MGRRKRGSIQHNTINPNKELKGKDERVISGLQSKLEEFDKSEQEEVEELDSDDLKNLVFLGRLKEVVNIGGFEFVITTLNNLETTELISDLSLYDIKDRPMALRYLSLARGIISVNNAPVESLYSGDDEELSDLEKRIQVVNSWQTAVVNLLFDRYDALLEKSRNIFLESSEGDEIKN